MRKILITGAAGFVGRHLTRRFLELKDEVYAVDSVVALTGGIDPEIGWPLFDPRSYRNFHFNREDCRSYFKRVHDTDFDYTFHLAAVVGGREMIEYNPLSVADDLSIDAAYWQWAVQAKPRKSVCFSSSAAYPIRFQRPNGYQLLRENMIEFESELGMPDKSYGWAKLTHEYLAHLAYEKHGLRSVVYRPFSGYGEDQHDAYPFPGICKRVLSEKSASVLQVWGSGNQMRDFIHIEDCVDGILRTMDSIDNAEAINLSTGIFTSFKHFAKTAANLCGYDPEVIGSLEKPEGVFARGGDVTKQHSLGFMHKIEFKSGIERALSYYSRRM
jgi:nucleoside-diphosphate-sugar epimerase